jgi:hypothetical protein
VKPTDGAFAPGAVISDAEKTTNERKGMLVRKYDRKTPDPEVEGQKKALLGAK